MLLSPVIGQQQCAETFRRHFTDSMLRLILKKVKASYRFSSEHFVGYRFASKETRGNHRRGVIEDLFQDFGAFEPSVTVTNTPYTRRNSGEYTALRCGPVVLTFSKTENENQLPRAAQFRQTLARGSEFLFDDEALLNQTTPSLHAILYHSPSNGDVRGRVPKFVNIGFPDQSYSHYVVTIPLLGLFEQELVQEETMSPTIAGPKLTLKRDRMPDEEKKGA
jgi:hypothetical protein